jgi:RNA polymerase sigma factor (sigma-70 family)
VKESDCDLSVEEAHRLIEEIQANPTNATAAYEKLTAGFDKLVRWQAYKLHKPAIYDDLVQVGYLALMHAARKFKAGRGAKFSTFATIVIRNRMASYVRHERNHGVTNKYRSRLDHQVKPVKDGPDAKPTSLEELASDGSTEREAALMVDLNRFEPLLGPALAELSERQEQAMVLHYFYDEKPSAIARRMGVTPPRVTALLKTGVERLGENILSLHLAA